MPKDTAVMDDAPATPAETESGRAAASAEGPGASIRDADRLAPGIEAILLTSDKPVPAARLAEALGLAAPADPAPAQADHPALDDEAEPATQSRRRRRKPAAGAESADPETPNAGSDHAIAGAVASLNRVYAETRRSFRIEQVAGGYRIMTLPDFAPVIAAFHRSRTSSRLSRAAVETLAIIAYRQPLTRAHLEAIRGVSCGEVLRSLMERKLITIKGRAEELGRPILYGTTREFLDAFGLASLKDLPSASELQIG